MAQRTARPHARRRWCRLVALPPRDGATGPARGMGLSCVLIFHRPYVSATSPSTVLDAAVLLRSMASPSLTTSPSPSSHPSPRCRGSPSPRRRTVDSGAGVRASPEVPHKPPISLVLHWAMKKKDTGSAVCKIVGCTA